MHPFLLTFILTVINSDITTLLIVSKNNEALQHCLFRFKYMPTNGDFSIPIYQKNYKQLIAFGIVNFSNSQKISVWKDIVIDIFNVGVQHFKLFHEKGLHNHGDWYALKNSGIIHSIKNSIFLIIENFMIQSLIQKVHLERIVQKFKILAIEVYLDIGWAMNMIILSYLSKDQRAIILNQQKNIINQLESQEISDIQVSHKIITQSFIKNIKSFQNTGINCTIISAPQAQINKEILNFIKDKIPQKQRKKSLNSQVVPPTKQISLPLNKIQVNDSSMTERQKLKQPFSQSMLTQRVNQTKQNSFSRQGEQKQHFQIKNQEASKNSTKKYLQDEAYKKGINSSQKLLRAEKQRPIQNKVNYMTQIQGSKSFNQQLMKTNNPNNIGIVDINMSQNSEILKNSLSVSNFLQVQIAKSQLAQPQNSGMINKQQRMAKSFLPSGVLISSIDIKKSHPFQINISNLSNPLQMSKTQVLPASIKNRIISQKFNPTNLENPKSQKFVESFSQSSIQNKLESSVSQSEYSDMFDSQQDQNKVQCRVEAVVQNQKKQSQQKPRLEIYMIELYSNSNLKFYSLYEKVVFEGRLLRMLKKPDNYYELIVQQYKNQQKENMQIKQVQQNLQQKVQAVQLKKRVKFRGQAKMFMKYLIK